MISINSINQTEVLNRYNITILDLPVILKEDLIVSFKYNNNKLNKILYILKDFKRKSKRI